MLQKYEDNPYLFILINYTFVCRHSLLVMRSKPFCRFLVLPSQLFGVAMRIITHGHFRFLPLFHLDFATERYWRDAFIQVRLAFSGYVGYLVVVEIGDAGMAFEVVDEILSCA